MMSKLKNLLKKNNDEYRYPTAALCLDSGLGKDIIQRSEHILKHAGYIVIKVINFKRNAGNDETSRMYDEMDMQVIRDADVVYGVYAEDTRTIEQSIQDALDYARENKKHVDMLHFV